MNEKIHDKNTDFLFKAILALETPEECTRAESHVPAAGSGPYAQPQAGLQRHRGPNWGFYSHHQPRKPFFELWLWRLQTSIRPLGR